MERLIRYSKFARYLLALGLALVSCCRRGWGEVLKVSQPNQSLYPTRTCSTPVGTVPRGRGDVERQAGDWYKVEYQGNRLAQPPGLSRPRRFQIQSGRAVNRHPGEADQQRRSGVGR